MQGKINPVDENKVQYKKGGKLCGHLAWLGNHEKSDRIRPGWPMLVWLSAGRGWMLCDGNNHFLGITTIPAIMLTVSGVLVNSPGFDLHIQNKTRST